MGGIHTTKKYHRVRKMAPSKCTPGSQRTITLSKKKGVKAVICRPKGKTKTRIQSELYPTSKYTKRQVRKRL